MARKRVVSSTITEVNIVCKFFDLTANKLIDKLCVFGADFDESKAEKLIRAEYDNDTCKLVLCGKAERHVWLYKMSEKKFMHNATKSAYRGATGRTRERKVTRTIAFYEVPCKFFDLTTNKLIDKLCVFGADFDESKAEKLIRAEYDNDTCKLVLCGKAERKTAFYEMSERKYILLAERVRELSEEELAEREKRNAELVEEDEEDEED